MSRQLTESQPTLPPESTDAPSGTLSLAALESHLWAVANILPGKIDSSDFKHYIFGLLFFNCPGRPCIDYLESLAYTS